MYRRQFIVSCFVAALAVGNVVANEPATAVRLWPDQPPHWTPPKGEERDTSGPDSNKVAGRSLIRLGNVSQPELHLFPADGASTTVIICPGGGFSILAWDLEGTEIAAWLQQNGIAAAVLKYRVPTNGEATKWLPPVQDLQRSIALVRGGSIKSLPSKHVGVLGFSAGGHTAARTALATERLYDAVDDHDHKSVLPDFAALIYTAYLNESRESEKLAADIHVTDKTPPMFFAHAFDDAHSCMGSVALFSALKRNKIPSSLHVFSSGGHGFGARDTGDEKDLWMPLLKMWLGDRGF